MKNNDIWSSISRKIANEGSEQDDRYVNEWLNSDPLNANVYKRLVEIWNYRPHQTHDSSRIYARYQNRRRGYKLKNNTTRVVFYTSRIAAIFLLIASLTILVDNYLNHRKESTNSMSQVVSVPRGSRTSIILSDSSKVWISNNTTLKYPSQFAADTREVYLSGGAYFEVSPNKKRPFIVNMGKNRIKVLGTKFSVLAYPDDNHISADLLKGKILFDIKSGKENTYKSVELKPGFGLVFDKTENKITEHKIEDKFYEYWQKGVYSFRNETFGDLSKKIFQIYNVKIVFLDEYLKSKTYSGSLSVNDNILTFMESIKRTSIDPIKYTYQDDMIFVKLE